MKITKLSHLHLSNNLLQIPISEKHRYRKLYKFHRQSYSTKMEICLSIQVPMTCHQEFQILHFGLLNLQPDHVNFNDKLFSQIKFFININNFHPNFMFECSQFI